MQGGGIITGTAASLQRRRGQRDKMTWEGMI